MKSSVSIGGGKPTYLSDSTEIRMIPSFSSLGRKKRPVGRKKRGRMNATIAELSAMEWIKFEGLGKHRRKIATRSTAAQEQFDQGLAFLYAFNHDEAIISFDAATRSDPNCAMAWWGLATANGPHINNPEVSPDRAKAGYEAARKARQCKPTGAERDLIEAAAKRFSPNPSAPRAPLDRAYADAMRQVAKKHNRDADIQSLFAEAMMDLRPWDLWTHDYKPQPGTLEIVSTLERAMAIDPHHPLALHLYIHAVEASAKPERAVAPADRLRDLQPGLGHMVHMPSHIDVRTGAWFKAITANQKAMAADAAYRARRPRQGFYSVYMAHNHHMLTFAAMMVGQSNLAMRTIDAMVTAIPEEFLIGAAPIVDGFLAMPFETRLRFGQWNDVLDFPEPHERYPLARALRHAARACALAALARPQDARLSQAQFYQSRRRVPADSTFGNNASSDVLLVATHMMNGEILIAEGKMDQGIATLRMAVEAEDKLRYDEPPDWILPTRHPLGAALIRTGRFTEAEAVYREDLRRLPHNGWSLYGMSRAYQGLGDGRLANVFSDRFARMWSQADIEIVSSCLCIPLDAGASK